MTSLYFYVMVFATVVCIAAFILLLLAPWLDHKAWERERRRRGAGYLR
jgi:quinol-cytochrome oxidoreductase complex cytochrome b subunit